jgi:transcriptional regulator with XRE-family HTH domain
VSSSLSAGEELHMSFQSRLKETRQARNISIRRLCADLKIRKSTYENWEINVYPSRPELYKRLAVYLDVPLEYLMFGERKNTEWGETVRHLEKYLEEAIEEKVKLMVGDIRPSRSEILGQGRGVLS